MNDPHFGRFPTFSTPFIKFWAIFDQPRFSPKTPSADHRTHFAPPPRPTSRRQRSQNRTGGGPRHAPSPPKAVVPHPHSSPSQRHPTPHTRFSRCARTGKIGEIQARSIFKNLDLCNQWGYDRETTAILKLKMSTFRKN